MNDSHNYEYYFVKYTTHLTKLSWKLKCHSNKYNAVSLKKENRYYGSAYHSHSCTSLIIVMWYNFFLKNNTYLVLPANYLLGLHKNSMTSEISQGEILWTNLILPENLKYFHKELYKRMYYKNNMTVPHISPLKHTQLYMVGVKTIPLCSFPYKIETLHQPKSSQKVHAIILTVNLRII